MAVILAAFIVAPLGVSADSLFLSPSSAEFSQGKVFAVRVFVSSAAQAINAVSGTLSFPKGLVEVESISKSNSIIDLWVEEPAYSNAAGTISFEGLVLDGGFQGMNGLVLVVNFRAIGKGPVPIEWTGASVLANDGKGTNVLRSMAPANLIVGATAAPASVPAAALSKKLEIRSSTHPEEKRWYPEKDAVFSWDLPPNAVETRLLLSKQPGLKPHISYRPPITTRAIPDIEEGRWYFYATAIDSAGTEHSGVYEVKVDLTAPSFDPIETLPVSSPLDPNRFRLSASDAVSGIDYYEISIDGAKTEIWTDPGDGTYTAPRLRPGEHDLVARVFDDAGNSSISSVSFIAEGFSAPKIDGWNKKKIAKGHTLIVTGQSAPDSTVNLYIDMEEESVQVARSIADREGNFVIAWDVPATIEEAIPAPLVSVLLSGDSVRAMWLDAVDTEGRYSYPTEKTSIIIEDSLSARIGPAMIRFLEMLALAVGFVTIIIFCAVAVVRRTRYAKQMVAKEIYEAKQAVGDSFITLYKDLAEYICIVKAKTNGSLSPEDEAIIKRLGDHLEEAERHIRKELEDVERYMSKKK